MKKLIELSIKGVSAALVCFSLFGIVWNLVNGGDYIQMCIRDSPCHGTFSWLMEGMKSIFL